MKKILCVISLFCMISVADAAEYVVEHGDTLGKVVQITGCKMDDLATLNSISAPEYAINEGQIIIYPSVQDMALVRNWAMDHVATLSLNDPDYEDIVQIINDIDAGTIQYGNALGTHATEIIVIADFCRTYL